ncbi:MAG: hypothetical protein IJT57_00075 [Selenomonadaceae bacterium]|nr:hypothetical protein [Selenomonadaceae bacterium]
MIRFLMSDILTFHERLDKAAGIRDFGLIDGNKIGYERKFIDRNKITLLSAWRAGLFLIDGNL